jgi:hypothetical protein
VRISDIILHLRGLFESKRRNPVQLEADSNLESNLKTLKVAEESSPLRMSNDTIDVIGNLKVNGVDVSTEPDDTGAGGATELNELSDVTYSSGDLTISSLDKIVSGAIEIDSSADITLDASNGNVYIKDDGATRTHFDAGKVYLRENSAAGSDSDAQGQIWVKNDTPNCLAFTDDAGTDVVGIGKYQYETKFIGFYAGQTAQYLPMTGYVLEKTSTSSNNEFISFVAPFDGRIEKFIYRSEAGQDGTFSLRILESSDATETPSSMIYRKDHTIDIDDDTFLELDMTSPGVGSDYAPMTKGKIYAIYLSTPATGYDTNVTIVFRWDITT